MRILQLVPSLEVGGAERVAALLAGELRRRGEEVSVVSLFDAAGSWIEADLGAAGVPMRFLGKRPGLDPRMVPRLARVFRELRPDVIHTHLHVLKYALPARLAWGRGVVVHTLHNLAEREVEPQSQWVQRLAFRRMVEPVAIGEAVAASVERLYGFVPRSVIPNGIPTAASRAPAGARERVREALGIAADTPCLLIVGRLTVQKNHAGLLAALADPRLARARLLVAGDGELRAELAARAAALGVADRVRFLGVRADVPDLLAAADVFVLPSTWEGNPLVVMEAMAAGRAVVATAVGCVPELVTPESGRLVPPGDPAALADALAAFVAEPALRDAAGEAGARRARARFDVAGMADAYLSLYATLLRAGVRSDPAG